MPKQEIIEFENQRYLNLADLIAVVVGLENEALRKRTVAGDAVADVLKAFRKELESFRTTPLIDKWGR